MITLAIFALPVGLLGLCLGSFVTTAALRATRGDGYIRGRSRCDGCGRTLSFTATLPLASFARQGGVATCCDHQIARLHPAGEIAGLMIALLALATGQLVLGVLVGTLGFTLLALATTDIIQQRLPNPMVALVALLAATISLDQGGDCLIEGVGAVLCTFILLWGVRLGFQRMTNRAGLGGGDVKLLAALALWLGLMTPAALALASMIGLAQAAILRPTNGRVAFGPAIAIAGLVVGVANLYWRWAP